MAGTSPAMTPNERFNTTGIRCSAHFDHIESHTRVVAGLVPATSLVEAQSKNNRGGRDKPGHDRERGSEQTAGADLTKPGLIPQLRRGPAKRSPRQLRRRGEPRCRHLSLRPANSAVSPRREISAGQDCADATVQPRGRFQAQVPLGGGRMARHSPRPGARKPPGNALALGSGPAGSRRTILANDADPYE
jgi:hypothetical protein